MDYEKLTSKKQGIKNAPDYNQRQEIRYPCVGIPLMYSPLENTSADDLAHFLQTATATVDISLTGMAFDIEEQMIPGDRLIIYVTKSKGKSPEGLTTKVRWCKELSPGNYRVGVKINSKNDQTKTRFDKFY